MAERSIAITGVTGFIGSRLGSRALAEGWRVRAFSRRPWRGAPHVPIDERRFLESPARPRPGDLDGIDAVVHLSTAPQDAPADVAWAVNVGGTRLLHRAALEVGVARFIFVSTQSAHEGVASTYGRTKLAAERAVSSDERTVIVRPGLVYGDGDEGLLGRAARIAARVRLIPVIGRSLARARAMPRPPTTTTRASTPAPSCHPRGR
jgi:nucleoside-diphosphate-sugar epimerase